MNRGRTAELTHLCRSCHGTGEIHFSPTHEEHQCSMCKGAGYITEAAYNEWNETGLDRQLAKKLRDRMARAFSERDDSLGGLLRDAAERLEKRP